MFGLLFMFVLIVACICIYVCVYVCANFCVCAYVYIFIYIYYIHVYFHIHIYPHRYLLLYIYIYMFCCTPLTRGGRHMILNMRYAALGNTRPKPQEALRETPQGYGRDFGRQASKEDKVRAPKDYADARRPCVQLRTQSGNPKYPVRSPSSFRAAGQAPSHRVTKSQHGELFGIPRIYIHV